jgi:hypothetical protein
MTLEQARSSVTTCFVYRGISMKVVTATRGEIGNPHSIEVYTCESPDGMERFIGWLSEMPVGVRLAYALRFIRIELPFQKLTLASSSEERLYFG